MPRASDLRTLLKQSATPMTKNEHVIMIANASEVVAECFGLLYD